MTPHRNLSRRWLELALATYGVIFGFGVFFLISLGGEPLYWLKISVETQANLALIFLFGGTVHATGAWINGVWKWSALCRVVGLGLHATAVSWISIAAIMITIHSPHGLTSGVVTYTPIALLLWWLAKQALGDFIQDYRLWGLLHG